MSGRSYGFIRKAEEETRRAAFDKAVDAYTLYIADRPEGMFIDTKELPYKKQIILGGLVNRIANAKTKVEADAAFIVAIALSDFQDDVGEPIIIRELPHSSSPQYKAVLSDMQRMGQFTDKHKRDLDFINDLGTIAMARNQHIRKLRYRLWEKFRKQGIYDPSSDGYVDVCREVLKF